MKTINSLEFIDFSVETSLDNDQLLAVKDMIDNKIIRHIADHPGLYSEKNIAVLTHLWTKNEWVRAAKSSLGMIKVIEI